MIYLLAVPGPIEDVEEVRVLEWHGEPGHAFAAGDLIVELETHKALVEVRAGQPGVMRRIRASRATGRQSASHWLYSATIPPKPCPRPPRAWQRLRSNFRSVECDRAPDCKKPSPQI